MGLAAVLWRFLGLHERCVAERCAVPAFDTVTTVPSTSGRTGHPLRAIVAEMVGATRERYRELLTPTETAAALGRSVSTERYRASAPRGSVLLIDDTWTSGNHAQAASAALKDAGADKVAVVVLGRHLNPAFGGAVAHVAQARLRRFSWDVCALRGRSHG